MKLHFLSLLVLFFASQQGVAADKPGVHGMLVFGEKTIYLSHLRMFHAPHDYQAIFSVKVSEEARNLYLADKKSHPEESVYTFVPEVMVLPDVVLKTKTFKGELYRGHFERGGTLIASNINIQIQDLISFKKFDPAAERPTQVTYIVFGQPGEYWMAHDIVKKPDFDHILTVSLQGGPTIQQAGTLLTLDNAENLKPLADGKSLSAKSGSQTFILESRHTSYLEFDDLSM